MISVALTMLFGDRTKYITLVLGLAFAALLMNQQGAIFLGLLKQSTGPLQNVHQPDLWVTDPQTPWIAEYRFMSEQKLARVRSIPGVEWAEPFFNGQAVCELPGGGFKRVQIFGISRTTLAGGPSGMVEGRVENLWQPDAILVEKNSVPKLGDIKVGGELKLNDRRAVVVGVCKARQGFEGNAIVYTTFENAVRFTPTGRRQISYVLVKVREGTSITDVQSRINAMGDVSAFTPREFALKSKQFIIFATGIGVNFGITIALGFVVGLLLSASIFYQFTLENLRYYAVLKALGTRSRTLVAMILLQAMVVGLVGYGIGTGAAGAFTIAALKTESELTAILPWQLLVGSLAGTLLTIGLGSVLSLRRVLMVPPGVVFAS
jgi:putative ABC transport system permease protein